MTGTRLKDFLYVYLIHSGGPVKTSLIVGNPFGHYGMRRVVKGRSSTHWLSTWASTLVTTTNQNKKYRNIYNTKLIEELTNEIVEQI